MEPEFHSVVKNNCPAQTARSGIADKAQDARVGLESMVGGEQSRWDVSAAAVGTGLTSL